jgi:hypothetical protein
LPASLRAVYKHFYSGTQAESSDGDHPECCHLLRRNEIAVSGCPEIG